MKKQPEQGRPALLQFPCQFTIKVFGHAAQEKNSSEEAGVENIPFEKMVIEIISRHITPSTDGSPAYQLLQSRHSQEGKYIALSIQITAASQAQLDQIYRDLSSSPHVLMAL